MDHPQWSSLGPFLILIKDCISGKQVSLLLLPSCHYFEKVAHCILPNSASHLLDLEPSPAIVLGILLSRSPGQEEGKRKREHVNLPVILKLELQDQRLLDG